MIRVIAQPLFSWCAEVSKADAAHAIMECDLRAGALYQISLGGTSDDAAIIVTLSTAITIIAITIININYHTDDLIVIIAIIISICLIIVAFIGVRRGSTTIMISIIIIVNCIIVVRSRSITIVNNIVIATFIITSCCYNPYCS